MRRYQIDVAKGTENLAALRAAVFSLFKNTSGGPKCPLGLSGRGLNVVQLDSFKANGQVVDMIKTLMRSTVCGASTYLLFVDDVK